MPEVPDGLDDRPLHVRNCDISRLGAGAALLDIDGDGRDDLLLGGYAWRDAPSYVPGCVPEPIGGFDRESCVFRNASTPGNLRFEPVSMLCDGHLPRFTSAVGIDVDDDDRDEALLVGEGKIHLLRFHPEIRLTTLVDGGSLDVYRPYCFAGSAMPIDLDHDGVEEVLVACQYGIFHHLHSDFARMTNIVLRRHGETLVVDDRAEWSLLRDDGITLAVAALDVDDNGLLDVLVANESFTTTSFGGNFLSRGFLALRCLPGEPCVYHRVPLGEGLRESGSYMGVGVVRTPEGWRTLVTDWGANRFLRWTGSILVDEALERGVSDRMNAGELLVSWSAIVDDFNHDGRDDVLVTNGWITGYEEGSGSSQIDTLFLQDANGMFRTAREDAGFFPPIPEDSPSPGFHPASRAGLRTDLDLDGRMDVFVLGYPGYPRVYRESSPGVSATPRRCLIRPVPRYVPGTGVGYRLQERGATTWHQRDVQGHVRLGAPRSILASFRRGTLAFPSGAEVPFACSEVGAVTSVTEPEWLSLTRESGVVRVEIDLSVFPRARRGLSAIVRDREGTQRSAAARVVAPGRFEIAVQPHEVEVLFVVEGFHVARWFRI